MNIHNGVAQGCATDQAARILSLHGFTGALVNIGEFKDGNEDWRIGVSHPAHGVVEVRTLRNAASASSSPGALILPGGGGHIFGPRRLRQMPLWSTVNVEAVSAGRADVCATSFPMMTKSEIKTAMRRFGRRQLRPAD